MTKTWMGACLGVFVALHLCTVQPDKVGPDARWQPPPNFMRKTHEQCRGLAFPALGRCFVKQMRRAGASPAAAAFAHEIKNGGYLRRLQMTGKVDVAYVTYPFRANENDGVLLVNGRPPRIDVDALNSLPQASMRSDPIYRKLLAQYPSLSLWPGDRSGIADPIAAEKTKEGGQRFLVHYWEQNGCHACARVGVTTFAFNFDSSGRFLGAKYVGTRQTVSSP